MSSNKTDLPTVSPPKSVAGGGARLAQLMSDEEIIKRRLLIDGDGAGEDRKFGMLIKQFILWCYSETETEAENQVAAERLLSALDQSEVAMARSVQTIRMIARELGNYETIYGNIQKAILDAKEKLQQCKLQLANAKQLRRNKLDYDSVATVLDQHPSTQETQKKLSLLEEEIQGLQKINTQIEKKLEKRRRQFQLLLTASHALQNVLDDDSNNASSNNNHNHNEEAGNGSGANLEGPSTSRSPAQAMDTN